jgi:hypothetical protein
MAQCAALIAPYWLLCGGWISILTPTRTSATRRMGPLLRGDDKRFFSFINIKFSGFAGIVIHTSRTSLILLASCPMRGRFLEAILRRTERELAGPGRPGMVDRLVAKVERREAPRPTSLGARGSFCRARWVRYSRLKGARWHPGASRRSTPSRGCRGTANLGRFAPREYSGTPVIPGRRDRTAHRAARSRRIRNPDVTAS